MTNTTDSSCPQCGAPLPVDAPQGLCPKCVMSGAAITSGQTSAPKGKTPPPTVAEVAVHFPDLEILELIGSGGMGAVFKARQPKLDRVVALKILAQELSDDPAFVERFNREGRVLARLSHPNIVTIFDYGTAGPFAYLLMEHVDGVNLRQAMRASRFAPMDALSVVQDMCAALQFAHEDGILHRDIKPENILIDSRGRVKIADFGIAKLIGATERDDVTLTMHGSVMGSPHYMAPEQIEAPDDVDTRADIYSLGVVFYELLTGELPIGRFAPPSRKTTMDPRVDEIVMRALEREREERYQTVGEVHTQVDHITRTAAADPQAPVPPAPEVNPLEAPATTTSAKGATASAILTMTSFGSAIVSLILFVIFNYDLSWKTWEIVVLCIMALGGGLICGFIGLLIGGIALGSIRRSGGGIRGFGRAMFGTLLWPVLLLLGGLLTVFITLGIAFLPQGAIAALLLIGVSSILGAWACVGVVTSVWRWVRAIPAGVRVRDCEGGWALGALGALLAVVAMIPSFLVLWLMPVSHTDSRSDRGPSYKIEPLPSAEPGPELR